jgi:hypothetical protein
LLALLSGSDYLPRLRGYPLSKVWARYMKLRRSEKYANTRLLSTTTTTTTKRSKFSISIHAEFLRELFCYNQPATVQQLAQEQLDVLAKPGSHPKSSFYHLAAKLKLMQLKVAPTVKFSTSHPFVATMLVGNTEILTASGANKAQAERAVYRLMLEQLAAGWKPDSWPATAPSPASMRPPPPPPPVFQSNSTRTISKQATANGSGSSNSGGGGDTSVSIDASTDVDVDVDVDDSDSDVEAALLVDPQTAQEVLNEMQSTSVPVRVKQYLEGIAWTMYYLSGQCADYNYHYSLFHAPTLDNLAQVITEAPLDSAGRYSISIPILADSQPMTPIPFALSLLPYSCRSHLPEAYQSLMDVNGPLHDVFHGKYHKNPLVPWVQRLHEIRHLIVSKVNRHAKHLKKQQHLQDNKQHRAHHDEQQHRYDDKQQQKEAPRADASHFQPLLGLSRFSRPLESCSKQLPRAPLRNAIRPFWWTESPEAHRRLVWPSIQARNPFAKPKPILTTPLVATSRTDAVIEPSRTQPQQQAFTAVTTPPPPPPTTEVARNIVPHLYRHLTRRLLPSTHAIRTNSGRLLVIGQRILYCFARK